MSVTAQLESACCERKNGSLPAGFLKEIPKTDLHVHLDGSVRMNTLVELAREKNVSLPSYDSEELAQILIKDSFNNLEDYLECFKYTTAVMQDATSMERIAYEFAVDNYSEGVRYFEVRFAPQLHASIDPTDDFMVEDVVVAVNKGLDRATSEFNVTLSDDEPEYTYGIILTALRFFVPEMSRYYRAFCSVHQHLNQERICSLASEVLVLAAVKCRDELGLPVVAFDIAGAEKGFRAATHRDAFDIAHSHFMNKTVHAGEGFGPESIFQAVNDCHAERIGHGYHLFSSELVVGESNLHRRDEYVTRLTKFICDRRICLEICLTSNMNTMPGLKLKDHAFGKMIKNGVSVCLNTDNRTISKTTVEKELARAVETFGMCPHLLRSIVLNGFKRSFYKGTYVDRCNYIKKVVDYYDLVAKKYGVDTPDY